MIPANDTTPLAPWTARSWYEHVRAYHPHRAANSFAKHFLEFPHELVEALAIITAQVMCTQAYNSERHRFDMLGALQHLRERIAARRAKVLAA